jgi:hypothetical protein
MDDSVSMKEHWDDVVSLFSVFAYIAKRLDDDGLEVCHVKQVPSLSGDHAGTFYVPHR